MSGKNKNKKAPPSSNISNHQMYCPLLAENTTSLIDRAHYHPKYQHYLHTLLDCSDSGSQVRTPDEYSSPTELYRSVVQFPIDIDSSANPEGLVSIYVSPDPNALAFYSPPTSRGTWNDAKNNNVDLLTVADPNMSLLFASQQGMCIGQGTAVTQHAAINAWYQDSMPWSSSANPGVTTFTFNGMGSFTPVARNFVDDATSITLPGNPAPTNPMMGSGGLGGLAGWHNFNVFPINTGTALNTGPRGYPILYELDPNGAILGYLYENAGSLVTWGTFSLTGSTGSSVNPERVYTFDSGLGGTRSFTWAAVIHNAAQSLSNTLNLNINCVRKNYYGMAMMYIPVVTNTNTTFTYQITKVAQESLNDEGAIAQKLRPVAQQVLVTNIESALYRAGRIVASELPSGTRDQVFDDGPTAYSQYEFLASQMYPNASYTGGADKGVYGARTPLFPTWKDFRKLSEFEDIDYGGIMVNATVNGLPTGVSRVFNVTITTLYEYTTTSPVVTPKVCIGNPLVLYDIIGEFAKNQHFFENPKHSKSIIKTMSKALFPIANLPTAVKYAKSPEGQQIIGFLSSAAKYIPGYNEKDPVGSIANILSKAALYMA